jgi:predicted transcriptional regulator
MNFKEHIKDKELPSIGIYINDDGNKKYMDLILSGKKTIETRNNKKLSEYSGQRVGLIRTGRGKTMVVGYATIGDVIQYNDERSFRKDENKHFVFENDERDILKTKNGIKYGYPLLNVESEPNPYRPKYIQSPLKNRYTATIIN